MSKLLWHNYVGVAMMCGQAREGEGVADQGEDGGPGCGQVSPPLLPEAAGAGCEPRSAHVPPFPSHSGPRPHSLWVPQ